MEPSTHKVVLPLSRANHNKTSDSLVTLPTGEGKLSGYLIEPFLCTQAISILVPTA